MFRFLGFGRRSPREVAERLVADGNRASEDGFASEAARLYRKALAADPTWSVPHFNLGLAAKYAGRWEESRAFNREAARLDPDDEGAWWNLGIAATALGDWEAARRAWAACNAPVPPGDGPPDANLGMVPVRLDPDGQGEVVCCRRIDYARARIESIPLEGSGFRFGDLLLTDGAAVGHRVWDGVKVPVFNALARLEASPLRTHVGAFELPSPEAWPELERIAREAGGAAEDWGSNVHILCKACSEGTVDAACTHRLVDTCPPKAVAARDESHLRGILARWRAAFPGIELGEWRPGAEAPPWEAGPGAS